MLKDIEMIGSKIMEKRQYTCIYMYIRMHTMAGNINIHSPIYDEGYHVMYFPAMHKLSTFFALLSLQPLTFDFSLVSRFTCI